MAGLRERKKQQTRQHISDVATRLFLERGFVTVTVAEVADAADVSVNTVYNYFPAKEDLFFDREEEVVDLPSRRVRERGPGQSAADALLGGLRQDVEERSSRVGLQGGYDRFLQVIQAAPTLQSRLMGMQIRMSGRLAETLRGEAGAGPDDHTPEVVAGQLMLLYGIAFRTVAHGTAEGASEDDIARLLLEKLDTLERLYGDEVRGYLRRPA
ncbi:TetR/AcrR family transcriptional regulator [Streptomyces sp. B6B3]|uniref:TetR/AcrR family transcriptional regulator n=1 Tax=Streptomyces sp. B6B3 TaxID=3153570 RepID=UPI00325DAD48